MDTSIEKLSSFLDQNELQQIPSAILTKIEIYYEKTKENIQKQHQIELNQKNETITKLKAETDNPEKVLQKMFPRAAESIRLLNNNSKLTEIYSLYHDTLNKLLSVEAKHKRTSHDRRILELDETQRKLQERTKECNDLKNDYYEYRTDATNKYHFLNKQYEIMQRKIDIYKKDIRLLEDNNKCNVERLQLRTLECETSETSNKILNENRQELERKVQALAKQNKELIARLEVNEEIKLPQNKRRRRNSIDDGMDLGTGERINLECTDKDSDGVGTSYGESSRQAKNQVGGSSSQLTAAKIIETDSVVGGSVIEERGSDRNQVHDDMATARTQGHDVDKALSDGDFIDLSTSTEMSCNGVVNRKGRGISLAKTNKPTRRGRQRKQ